MEPKQAYNVWAAQYDTNHNKTRDLEAVALQQVLKNYSFQSVLEIGCGTGKNTPWLLTKAQLITAVDLSDAMLAKAQEKIQSEKVSFVQADILQPWTFSNTQYDLVTFSLVLEHIEELVPIFEKAAAALKPGGFIYIGELHPFKQYSGSKARFETETGTQIVNCFTHHLSDFNTSAAQAGFKIELVQEYFDDEDRTSIPRILALLLQKK